MCERLTKAVHGGMQLPLDGTFRKSERFCDLAQLQTLMMSHHEDEPLPVWKTRDFCLQDFAEFPGVRAVFRPRRICLRVEQRLFGLLATRRGTCRELPPSMVDTGIHDDPVEPGRELRVLAELVKRTVHLDEDFLRDVFSIVVVARELVRDSIHHGSMPLDERLKGGRVAARRAGDQL